MQELNEWQNQAVTLHLTGILSWREIAALVGKPKSTVSDFLRKYVAAMAPHEEEGNDHVVIFDTQMRPGISTNYLEWMGWYCAEHQPSVIVFIGDHADMPSLSSYDKGKRSAENKRYKADIEAAIEGMEAFLKPIRSLQAFQEDNGLVVYNPRMVITLGNHEHRIVRYVDDHPEMHGHIGLHDLKYEEMGWEVVPFLTPINIDGVMYCHYFQNVMTGKPLGGTAANMLKVIGESFTMGHRQLLDIANRTLQSSGERQWGVICGSSYVHDEDYKGVQGNLHWRGIMHKKNVVNGNYDYELISMDALEDRYK